jgi:hypothetical protein
MTPASFGPATRRCRKGGSWSEIGKSMHKRHRLLLCVALLVLTGPGWGCQQVNPDTAPPAPAEASGQQAGNAGNADQAQTGETSKESKTPIQDAVKKMLADEAEGSKTLYGDAGHSPFPRGTRLLSADLKDSVVTLDFSSEFSALANMGDTTESDAQKILRKTLAQFPNVQKMRVTVEGKPFDSQATDWNTPFPVRHADTRTGTSHKTTTGGNDEERP